LVYKLPQVSRKDIEAMFSLSDLKQTKVYQEALEEGKLAAKLASIPHLLALGLKVEQIAQALELEIEQVRQTTQRELGKVQSDCVCCQIVFMYAIALCLLPPSA